MTNSINIINSQRGTTGVQLGHIYRDARTHETLGLSLIVLALLLFISHVSPVTTTTCNTSTPCKIVPALAWCPLLPQEAISALVIAGLAADCVSHRAAADNLARLQIPLSGSRAARHRALARQRQLPSAAFFASAARRSRADFFFFFFLDLSLQCSFCFANFWENQYAGFEWACCCSGDRRLG